MRSTSASTSGCSGSAVATPAADKLAVTGLRKTYGPVVALDSIDLSVRAGEFLTLLGPSGSGKTTLLWAIAGLNEPDRGEIRIDGVDATHKPPHARDLGMVFQNYALFPHLTVFDNIAFPLKMRRRPAAETRDAVADALATVKLGHVADRYPAALSGGQQQRIALARALVYRPSIVLMDEPLGALDKNLREHLQLEIKALHGRLGLTILYVTHDQEEAMILSDRICLMDHAQIEQLGTPSELYRRPKTRFAATFLGESNLIPVQADRTARTARLACGATVRLAPGAAAQAIHGAASLMLRPDALSVSATAAPTNGAVNVLTATVDTLLMAGAMTKVFARLETGDPIQANLLTGAATGLTLERGQPIALTFPVDAGVLLPPAQP